MTPTHLHLLLNHIPVLGTFFGLGLFAFGVWRRNHEIKTTSLGIFVIVALLTVPVYLTGEPAEETVESLPGVSKAIIEQHDGAAAYAFTGVIVTGVAALGGLIYFRKARLLPVWYGSLLIACSLVVGGLMAWTANLGGQIRHTEIRSGTIQSTSSGDKD